MEVKFIDLSRGYERYGKELEEEVAKVLRSGIYLNGENTKLVEKRLADYLGARFAIGVSSGTEALYLILKALELPKGSIVLVPSFTFIATSETVVRAGLEPYFVDIEEGTYNVSPEGLKEAYFKLTGEGKKVSAVVVVSLFGLPARLTEIQEFCREKGLYLVEDICQAFGAKIDEKKVGTFGIASATSFYPTKPLSACGDGGMVFTSDPALAEKVRYLKEHGQTKPYYYEYHGVNGRIDEVQCAVLKVKFKYFEKELALREKVASLYFRYLSHVEEVKLPFCPEGFFSSWALFTIRTEHRDELRNYLNSKGIGTGIYYAHPLHLQPVYQCFGFKRGDLPVTEKVSNQVLSLPMYPYLNEEEVKYVAESIKEFFARRGY